MSASSSAGPDGLPSSFLTLTCAEGRFCPCLPILQNPQQFSDERQNYTLPFTHTHRTLC